MTPDERLAHVRLKIERADKHIRDLNAEVGAFFKTNPYDIGIKTDPNTGKLVHYLVRVSPVPPSIGVITGDVLNNLRSALDHLAQQLYLVGSGSSDFRHETSFLIAQTAKKFKSGLSGKVEGMRQDAIDAICALEPYQGGNGADLWTFHRLNNIDKHRIILTAFSKLRSMDMGTKIARDMNALMPDWTKMTPFPFFLKPADKTPLKTGDIIAGADEIEKQEKRQFRFEIALYEPGVIEGEPLLETLMEFRNRVSGVVDSFRPCLA